jgi:hypothetical protein
MAAVCKNCGTHVGCGCQLVNGLCGACRALGKFINKITTLC